MYKLTKPLDGYRGVMFDLTESQQKALLDQLKEMGIDVSNISGSKPTNNIAWYGVDYPPTYIVGNSMNPVFKFCEYFSEIAKVKKKIYFPLEFLN